MSIPPSKSSKTAQKHRTHYPVLLKKSYVWKFKKIQNTVEHRLGGKLLKTIKNDESCRNGRILSQNG